MPSDESIAQRYGQRALDTLRAVITVCDTLGEFTAAGQEAFRRDTRTQWAAEMGLIRIGESVNRIPETLLVDFPGQPWRQIVAMRNFAAHQYDDLEPNRVWRTLTQEVPALRGYLADVVLGVPRGTGAVGRG